MGRKSLTGVSLYMYVCVYLYLILRERERYLCNVDNTLIISSLKDRQKKLCPMSVYLYKRYVTVDVES